MTLNDPDGDWKTPDGDAKYGYYDLKEWNKHNKVAMWLNKNIPEDGMCGWVSILFIIGWLTLDDLELRNKRPYRWAEIGWVKLLDFLKEVGIFIKYALGGP